MKTTFPSPAGTVTISISTDNMSKEQELALYDQWVRSLPANSYLRLYFGDDTVRNEFAWCIRNDFGSPDLPGVRGEVVKQREELAAIKRQLDPAETRLREFHHDIEEAERVIARAQRAREEAREQLNRVETAASHLRFVSRSLEQAAA